MSLTDPDCLCSLAPNSDDLGSCSQHDVITNADRFRKALRCKCCLLIELDLKDAITFQYWTAICPIHSSLCRCSVGTTVVPNLPHAKLLV